MVAEEIGEFGVTLAQFLLRLSLRGDVGGGAAIAAEDAALEDRPAAGAHDDARAVRPHGLVLEIAELLARVELRDVAAPRLLGDVGAGDLPARDAGDEVEVERRRRHQDLEAHVAMLGVGLPRPVGRQAGEIAQPLLDLALRRDVGAATAITAEDAVLEHRPAADADPVQGAVGMRQAVLEVTELRTPRQGRQMRLPVGMGEVGVGQFPARLADDAGRRAG